MGKERFHFFFEGRAFKAQSGDTAASALLASGVRILGRSVKYHRPRGVWTAGVEEPNALLTVGSRAEITPNVPATVLALEPNTQLFVQNCWPSARHDWHALLRLGGAALSTGFYYKTFMWPSWSTWEPLIRRLAGLGAAPTVAAPGCTTVEHMDCDVFVAGAGPAGLAAARAAALLGARVVLCEREAVCGGELEFESATVHGQPALAWTQETLDLLARCRARVLTGTALVSEAGALAMAYRLSPQPSAPQRIYRIRARALIHAMGAVEHGIAFINNDLPGVMLLGAAERYLARHGVCVGRRVVLFGNHDRLYAGATRLLAAGMAVVAIIDTRDMGTIGADLELLARQGVSCLAAHVVQRAWGGREVCGVVAAPRSDRTREQRFTCDALLVSGGWSTALDTLPANPTANDAIWRSAVGAASGRFELSEALNDGTAAGNAAVEDLRIQSPRAIAELKSDLRVRGDPTPMQVPFFRVPASASEERRQFVDLQNDVTVADLRQAVREGFRDIEHVKRYTTLAVGTDQGRASGRLGTAIAAEFSATPADKVRTSRSRFPLQPVALNAIAAERQGLALRPERHTPLHDWHVEHGAVMEGMGLWLRPRYYAANGSDAATAGPIEASRVRDCGGVFDASTLGKIEITGADSTAYLDRLYLNRASTIRVGRAKYMVLLREDGMVLDDGLLARLEPGRFLATISSGHAQSVLSHFEFWCELEFGSRPVYLAEVTDAWAVIVVAGPQSRDALARVLGLEWAAFLGQLNHMEVHAGTWNGAELRVLRASFTGELGFELHCRRHQAPSLWLALTQQGLTPFGLEALDILRVEKGYLGGGEINGQTTPQDLGFSVWVDSAGGSIGGALLTRPALREEMRPRLVGLRARDCRQSFLAGAQLTESTTSQNPCGHVTSAAYSPAFGRSIGLGLVSRRLMPGASLLARDPLRGYETWLELTAPAQFDPHGARMKA